MPMTLQKLRSLRPLPFEVEIAGDTVVGTWSAAGITSEMEDLSNELIADKERADDEAAALNVKAIDLARNGDVAGAEKAKREASRIVTTVERAQKSSLRQLLSGMLVEWDLLDGDVMYPTDEESLGRLPPFFILAVFNSIMAENRPDPTKAPNSADLSSTTATSEQSPPGTSSSEPPDTSESLPGSSTQPSNPLDITPSGDAGPS